MKLLLTAFLICPLILKAQPAKLYPKLDKSEHKRVIVRGEAANILGLLPTKTNSRRPDPKAKTLKETRQPIFSQNAALLYKGHALLLNSNEAVRLLSATKFKSTSIPTNTIPAIMGISPVSYNPFWYQITVERLRYHNLIIESSRDLLTWEVYLIYPPLLPEDEIGNEGISWWAQPDQEHLSYRAYNQMPE